MSQKDDSLPQLLNFEDAKLAKNRHIISEIADICKVGLIAINLYYIEDYTQRTKSTLKQGYTKKIRFTSQ